MENFADFEIWIGMPTPSTSPEAEFPTRVFSSLAGPAVGTLKLDLEAANFKANLVLVRGIDPEIIARRREFGTTLFNALIADGVEKNWIDSWGRVKGGAAEGL